MHYQVKQCAVLVPLDFIVLGVPVLSLPVLQGLHLQDHHQTVMHVPQEVIVLEDQKYFVRQDHIHHLALVFVVHVLQEAIVS